MEVQHREETSTDTPAQIQKTKSLRELYEHTPVINDKIQYALFSRQPTSFDEPVKDAQWVQAMHEEIDAIEKNQTWDLVDIHADKTSIGVKWVYKTKGKESLENTRQGCLPKDMHTNMV